MSELDRARDRYVERFEAWAAGRKDPAWLAALRRDALTRFRERGLPSTREEEWRYTNLEPLAAIPFAPAGASHGPLARADVEAISFPVFACGLFVFVNGRLDPSLSAPGALTGDLHVESLATAATSGRPEPLGLLADPKEHALTALATAFMDDGAVVIVPKGRHVEQPIHLVFVSTGKDVFACPRVLIRAEENSRATVIQDHVSIDAERTFTNVVTEVSLAANARLDLVLLQREHESAFHVSNLQARVGRDARFSSHTLTLSGALVRNDLGAVLAEEGAECSLDGLFLGTSRQTLDNHTMVDHAMPHGTSRELYKGILGGRSRGVFRGRVIVRPDAQKTDAQQSNPNLLVSDGAEINTKPQLEIYADDVKCSHGSSIGRIDEDALFYLRSRGLPERQARDLLTRGFAAEVLDRLSLPSLAEALSELLMERLHCAESSP